MRIKEIEYWVDDIFADASRINNTLTAKVQQTEEDMNFFSDIDWENFYYDSVVQVEVLIKTIQKSPFEKSLKKEIGELSYFTASKDTRRFNELKITLEKILAKFSILIDTVRIVEDNRNEKYNFVYAIKLPSFELFEDVAEFTKHLNQIFSIVLTDNKKAKLVGFDKGSEWYQVALDSLVDFKIFGLFLANAIKYVKIVLEDKRRENEVNFDAETKQLILENMNMQQKMIRQEYVRSVMNTSDVPQTPENFELHQMAFERMANLMLKGTEVHIERQIENNNEDSNEAPVLLPNLESVKGLLELYRDTLLEHNSESDSSDED
ncbi:hypothetical protein [Lysinibacillus sphaericus]|uniref:hypothetical protein n=1 Tax=Lysinibacillus sphaericus TaxID=1421 RepID=UPI001CBC1C43|nr:hypothetical protein [Lysinibacillus sphaericus]